MAYRFGRVYTFDYAFNLSGDSLFVESADIEFCLVAFRHTAMSNLHIVAPHVERTQVILTNADTVPLLRTATNWTDAGGNGTGISGSVVIDNPTFFLDPTTFTNQFVIKGQPGFAYSLIIRGGTFLGDHAQIGSSFTPANTSPYPDGTLLSLVGRSTDALTVYHPTLTTVNNHMSFGQGGLRAGILTTDFVLRITPQATPPGSCIQGDLYVDTSGALCLCTTAPTTWTNVGPSGSCS
jgi:hypothetical protein